MINTTYRKFLFLFIIAAFFSINSFSQVVWQRTIGFGNDTAEAAYDVYVNPDGSFIVAGKTTIGLLTKFDNAGNIVWKTYVPNTWNFQTIIPFDDTSYICVGSGVSIDTAAGNHWGTTDVVLARLNGNGTVLWKKYYGGSKGDNGVDVIKTTDGGFAVLANTNSTDGQLTGAAPLSGFESNAWVFKINTAGGLLWQKSLDYLDSTFFDKGNRILIANNQQLMVYAPPGAYLVDQNSGAATDFTNMNAALYNTTSIGVAICRTYNNDGYLAVSSDWVTVEPIGSGMLSVIYVKHIADDGLLISVDTITGPVMPTYAGPCGIIAMPGGGYICAGGIDVPAAGEPAPEYTNGYIYNSYTKQFLYFGNQHSDYFNSVKLLPGAEAMIGVGYANGYSSDIGATYTSDMWAVKINFNNFIRGNVFVDANNNNIQDAGEKGLKNTIANTASTTEQLSTQSYLPNGNYVFATGRGTYTTKVQLALPYYTSVPDSGVSVFNGNNQIDTVDFALHPIVGIKDYAVNAFGNIRVRPGFQQNYHITCSNNGTDTLNNRNLYFIKDHRFSFVSATPSPSSLSGDSIIWNISNVFPGAYTSISLTLQTATIPQVNIGDTLRSTVYIDSTGDAMTADNIVKVAELVMGSYDPNDKQENYAGNMPLKDIVDGKSLDYLIRFQNTGNDTAFTIVVRDTLDAQLDASSFSMLDASHNYQLSIKDGKYIAWVFNDIKLLDSFSNEPASHGYISYRIKPKVPIAIGSVISNRAAVYFDFNPAVLTNNQLTKVSGTIMPATWTGAVNTAWENPLNWNSGKVPDINTAVIIPSPVANYPEINSNVDCYSIHAAPSATILVKLGFRLNVAGKGN